MAIEFTCPACGVSYALPAELAGKLARCKQCKAVNRLPIPSRAPAAVPAGGPPRPKPATAPRARPKPGPLPGPKPEPAAADRFGFEDVAAIPSGRANPYALPDDEYQAPAPRRAPIRAERVERRDTSGEPWGLPTRKAAIVFLGVGFIVQLYRVLALGKSNPDGSLESFVMSISGLIGFGATIISVLGALFSFLGGNLRAFRSESAFQACAWYLAIAWSLFTIWIVGMVFSQRRAFTPPPAAPQPVFTAPVEAPRPLPNADPAQPMPPPVMPFQPDVRQGPRFGGGNPFPRGPRFQRPGGR